MKAFKKILALLIAMMVLASTCVFTAMADETDEPTGSESTEATGETTPLPEVDEANNPVSKLIAEYTFNNENVKDSVSLNHAIFYNNKAVSDPEFTEGVVGRGLQLSTKGTGQRYWLSIPYDVFKGNENTFSISMWYCASGYNLGGEDSELFSFYNSTIEAFMFYSPAAVAFQDKAFTMKWNGLNQGYGYANVITPYKENEWVHLVFCVEAVDNQSVITAYINGTEVEVDQGGDWDNSLMSQLGINNFTIGGKNPYKGGDVPMCLFYGAIDEVQIYSGVLNGNEAEYLYVTQLTAEDPEPVPEPDDPEPSEPEQTVAPTNPNNGSQGGSNVAPTTQPSGSDTQNDGNSGTVIIVIAVVAVVAVAVVVAFVVKKKKA